MVAARSCVPVAAMTSVVSRVGIKRHRWVKLRRHVYMCRHCGTAYENKPAARGQWYRVWYAADGVDRLGGLTPPCAPGVRGARALLKHADAL